MKNYILKRLLHILPMLLGISFISFLIIQLAPGDFFASMQMNPGISPELIQELKNSFGLEKNLVIQYLLWLKNMCFLNFGFSFHYKVPVSFLLASRMGNTLLLSITALLLSWAIVIPLGLLCALKKDKFLDRIISLFSVACIALP